MEPGQKSLSELVVVHSWETLTYEWNQVQQRWYTIYDHWYPLLTDEWPTDMLIVEAEWFYADVPLSLIQDLLKRRGIKWIWEFRGAQAPASFQLSPDLFVPCYTGDEGYWISQEYDWLIYASQESSLTFAGDWLVQAVKECWPAWQQHVWRGPNYIRPSQTIIPRPRGAFPGYQLLPYDAQLLNPTEQRLLWEKIKLRWQIPDAWSWYPLIGDRDSLSHILPLQEEWFSYAIPQERLVELLKQRGIKRVRGIKEGTIAWDVESELIQPWYDGFESYWTSQELDWVLYVSHESSITIAGEWFIEAVKIIWPEWEQHIWDTYAYESPPQWAMPTYRTLLPRSF